MDETSTATMPAPEVKSELDVLLDRAESVAREPGIVSGLDRETAEQGLSNAMLRHAVAEKLAGSPEAHAMLNGDGGDAMKLEQVLEGGIKARQAQVNLDGVHEQAENKGWGTWAYETLGKVGNHLVKYRWRYIIGTGVVLAAVALAYIYGPTALSWLHEHFSLTGQGMFDTGIGADAPLTPPVTAPGNPLDPGMLHPVPEIPSSPIPTNLDI